MLQKPVFALPGCQRMSVNTLLCDTLAFAEIHSPLSRDKSLAITLTQNLSLKNFPTLKTLSSLKNPSEDFFLTKILVRRPPPPEIPTNFRISALNERRRILITQIHVDLVFQACTSFPRCFRTLVAPIRKIRVYTGIPPCLVPSWLQIMQICISFRSRFDLVLDADNALDILSYLVLQACISFCSLSDESGASMFLPCSHKNAVAQMFWHTLRKLVRISL